MRRLKARIKVIKEAVRKILTIEPRLFVAAEAFLSGSSYRSLVEVQTRSLAAVKALVGTSLSCLGRSSIERSGLTLLLVLRLATLTSLVTTTTAATIGTTSTSIVVLLLVASLLVLFRSARRTATILLAVVALAFVL